MQAIKNDTQKQSELHRADKFGLLQKIKNVNDHNAQNSVLPGDEDQLNNFCLNPKERDARNSQNIQGNNDISIAYDNSGKQTSECLNNQENRDDYKQNQTSTVARQAQDPMKLPCKKTEIIGFKTGLEKWFKQLRAVLIIIMLGTPIGLYPQDDSLSVVDGQVSLALTLLQRTYLALWEALPLSVSMLNTYSKGVWTTFLPRNDTLNNHYYSDYEIRPKLGTREGSGKNRNINIPRL